MKNLVYKLMNEIGLDIDDQNRIYDQDTGNVINFNQKTLVYNFHIEIRPNFNELLFDPICNRNIMVTLFSYYLKKLEMMENKYFMAFYQLENNTTHKKAIELKANANEKIQSKFYANECLGYIELVFKLNNESLDLSQFDFI